MCVVSMVGDFYNDRFKPYVPYTNPPTITTTGSYIFSSVSKEEFDALKKEVEIMKALLIKAKLYDETNNEPNCEIDEKMELLKKIAALVGINLDDILAKK